MTRVIAGSARGRRLAVPPGDGTRPTSDRAREGLFSSLENLVGPWAGRRVLDLYAGSGAIGLEAVSRGAVHALLVESDPRTVRVIAANVASTGLVAAEPRAGRVERVVSAARPAGSPTYDVVVADPPYALDAADLHAVVIALQGGWLSAGAVLALERPTRGGEWEWPTGITALRSRRYGEATFWYGRAAQPTAQPEEVR